MTIKNRIISITLIATLCMIVLCAAGVTLAVSTSANRGSGSIATAGLSISAEAKNVAVYTAVAANDADSEKFEYDGSYYKYQQSNVKTEDGKILFDNRANGGVIFDDKSITIENVLPGDKVEFDIAVTSDSSIAFKYRAELFVDSTEGQTLLNNLNFESSNGLHRKNVSKSTVNKSDDNLLPAILTNYTEWAAFGANKNDVETIHVSIDLPLNASNGQGETVKLYYVARAEQSTATNAHVAEVTFNGVTEQFGSVKQAVDYAIANRVDTVTLIGSTNSVDNDGVITTNDEGTIEINRALTINSNLDDNGGNPIINGARFVIKDGAAATFNNVHFSGASYIDVSDATALTMNNCYADVAFKTDEGYFDESGNAREFLDKTPFIVSGTSLTPVTLNLNNNKILSDDGAVGLRSPVNNGSVITNNTFGSVERSVANGSVVSFNGGYDESGSDSAKAVIIFKNNKLYGETALSLGGKVSSVPYIVVSGSNSLDMSADKIFAKGIKHNGAAYAAFVDNGSTVADNELQFANIDVDGLKFGGIDVEVNGFNLIVSGKVMLSIEPADFYNNYTAGESTTGSIVVRTKD